MTELYNWKFELNNITKCLQLTHARDAKSSNASKKDNTHYYQQR